MNGLVRGREGREGEDKEREEKETDLNGMEKVSERKER